MESDNYKNIKKNTPLDIQVKVLEDITLKQQSYIEKLEEQLRLHGVSSSNNYLIRQTSEEEFIILKKYKETETEGYLWWKKTITKEEYQRIDKYGNKFFITSYPIYFTNLDELDTYKSREEAKRWIDNFNKYPIDYYC